MSKLEDTSLDDLHSALHRAEEVKAAIRLMVAIAYKDGVSVASLSDRYDIPRSTVYYWLDRFEEHPLDEALADAPRPGRPPKLSESRREAVESWLAGPPEAQGIDAEEWTPDLLRDHIQSTFGIDYSTGHVRRVFFG